MKLRLLTTSITLALSASVLAHSSVDETVSAKKQPKTNVAMVIQSATTVKNIVLKTTNVGPKKLSPKQNTINPSRSYHGHPIVKTDGVHGAIGNDMTIEVTNSCSVADYASTNNIANFVTSHDESCIDQLFNVAGANAQAIFNEANMVAVANLLRTKSSSYQGDNSSGIAQLIYFLRAGLYVAYYKADDIGVYSNNVKQGISYALDAFYSNSKAFLKTDDNAKVLKEAVTLIDSAELNGHFLWVVKRLLNNFDATSVCIFRIRN